MRGMAPVADVVRLPAPDAYDALTKQLLASGLVTDPWVDGRPRFAGAPLRLPQREAEALAEAAEAIAAAFNEVALAVLQDPALLDDFFALTPVQKLLWASSAPLWHGVARADLFFVEEAGAARPVVCELNADTPSGQPEAVLLGPATGVPPARDPNHLLEARTGELLRHFLARVERPGEGPATVGIIYPTEIAGDLGLVRLYQRWCERLGWKVVLGSPFNLQRAPGGGVAMFGTRCDLLVRHYKTDWWGERLPLWSDEDPYPDAEPLDGPLAIVLEALAARQVAVVNPFGSVLLQNKRAMAFLWERRDQLSPTARAAVEAYLPPTYRLEVMDRAQLLAERTDWVLKSDYGCEGEEVLLGTAVTAEQWQNALALALPRRFVVQRYFAARPGPAGALVNHGVYLVAGRAAGIYARLAGGATDAGALSAAVDVVPEVLP
jgi:glutathionylspermidine synthase